MSSHRQPLTTLLLLGLGAWFALPAQGEVFRLKSGGKIDGEILERGEQGEYVVRSKAGAKVVLSRRQIEEVTTKESMDLQYQRRSRSLPDTADAHRKLAEWCKENRLGSAADKHWQRVLELDPNDEAARIALGYQKHHGKWLTRDQIMAARGLQYYDGQYRTPQDIALRERTQQREKAEVDWFQQIRTWVGWLEGRRADEAVALITGVADPNAASGIVKLLKREKNQKVRDLLVETLAPLRHPLAVTTLVDLSLYDSDAEVRQQCLDYLLRYHQPLSVKPYVEALNPRSHDNETINRAAEALRRIDDKRALSPLIDALVTKQRFKIADLAPGNMQADFGTSGGGGFSAGRKPTHVDLDVKNLRVRQALVELSGGQDFEFNEGQWRRWYVNQKTPEFVDTRRDE